MTLELSTKIQEDQTGARLDQTLAKLFPDYSRAKWQQWIKEQAVLLDGQPTKSKELVKSGQIISVSAPLNRTVENWEARELGAGTLDIVYEDDHLLIINKPIGLVVHPAAGHKNDTLMNALLHYDSTLGNLPRAGLIHRIDKNTSGLLVVARTLKAHHHLVKVLQDREVKRYYIALVHGHLISGGTVDAPMGRHPKNRQKMAVLGKSQHAKPAVTHYRIRERFEKFTLLDVELKTGRTHQIRVHMQQIGYPVVGDPLYGGGRVQPMEFERQALHATRLGFHHPETKEWVEWEVEMPEDMEKLIESLRT